MHVDDIKEMLNNLEKVSGSRESTMTRCEDFFPHLKFIIEGRCEKEIVSHLEELLEIVFLTGKIQGHEAFRKRIDSIVNP